MRATGVFESFSKRRTPTAALRYGSCTQFINVSQRALHIYWQFSAMSHAIHKIVSKRRCQSYFSSRRSPHHGISKDSDLCASAHRCLHYAYARLIARVTFNLHVFNLPVDGLHAVFLQEVVGLAERSAAKETAVSRQRAGMRCL